MKKNSYKIVERKNHEMVVKHVQEERYPLGYLSGPATITHVGGNGSYKFQRLSETYITSANSDYATKEGHENLYYDIKKVLFAFDLSMHWSTLYIHHENQKDYWRPINESMIVGLLECDASEVDIY